MNKYLARLKQLLREETEDRLIKVVLYGSRARDNFSSASDVDIGLIGCEKIDRIFIVHLKEKIDALNIPYKVDIVDLSQTSQDFYDEVVKEAIVWKDYN